MITSNYVKYFSNTFANRWVYGVTPASSANFAWVQHFIHHLAPHGMAGFVLAVTASLSHSVCISDL